MAQRKVRVSSREKLAGYGILALLGLIALWLLGQQAHFNPAVQVAVRTGELPGRVAAAASSPAATAAFFPEVPGFTPRTPIESFGPQNLSDKINGKAELYLAAGFKEMSCRSFTVAKADGAHLEVFVYDMGSPANAYAVFSAQRRAGAPDLNLTSHAYTTANALFFTQGRFYVEMVADRGAAALTDQLSVYAQAVISRLPSEGEAPGTAGLFPPEGLRGDSVRLSAADTFGLEGFNQVFTAEYAVQGGTATAFLAERQTPAQAEAEARRYEEFLQANGYRKIQKPGVPESVHLYELDGSFEIVMLQGCLLAGVHDAPSAAAALELAAKLSQTLKGKP
ncbi:MAG: DUF6599 family protein [Desulfobaccales bacterium]